MEIAHFPGEKNVVADAFSRLDYKIQELSNFEDLFLKKRVFKTDVVFPMSYNVIKKNQEEYDELKLFLTNKTKAKAFSEVEYNKLFLWTYLTEGKKL